MVKRRNIVVVSLVLFGSFVLRVLWSKLYFWFFTSDEGFYAYWLKRLVYEGYFPMLCTTSRHIFSPGEIYIAWLPFITLEYLGFEQSEFLSLRITGLIQSFLTSLFLFLFIKDKVSNKYLALITFMFPPLVFLDWTVQTRGYGTAILSIALSLFFLGRRKFFLAGIFSNVWISPLSTFFFFPMVVMAFRDAKVGGVVKFIFGILIGSLILIIYNICNLEEYKKISDLYFFIPSFDDFIFRALGYQEGWIFAQCKISGRVLSVTEKFKIFPEALGISYPLKWYLIPSFIIYLSISMFGFVYGIFRGSPTWMRYFLIVIAMALFMSPTDKQLVVAYIPFYLIMVLGLDKLKYGLLLSVLIAISNISYILLNTKSCKGEYTPWKDMKNDIQIKNFSCQDRDDKEFFELYDFLSEKGIRYIISDFRLAPIINGYFYPEVMAMHFSGFDWTPEITSVIESVIEKGSENYAYVVAKKSDFKLGYLLDELLKYYRIKYDKISFENFDVYYNFSDKVFPLDIFKSSPHGKLFKCLKELSSHFENNLIVCIKKFVQTFYNIRIKF